jgi:hypothetical protein
MSSSDVDAPLLVLLGLRLKGVADTATLAARVGLAELLVRRELEHYQQQGWVLFREDRTSGWGLTPSGREEGARRLARELEALGQRSRIEAAYTRFVELNGLMLRACHDWQMVDATTLNDHSDTAYDAAVVQRLADVHEAVAPLCADLRLALQRFAPYGLLLGTALERVRTGEHDYFTGVRVPSYHSVWFELHEDLLATLGIDRGQETRRL